MNQPYQPIACALHDKYEIAIMFKQHIDITWQDDSGEQHTEKVLPVDLPVKNGEEFLLAKLNDDKELCIRLDRIALVD
jgi:transcriptional antiterminator Rof (Rho-off)